jgi:homoserine kinase type II
MDVAAVLHEYWDLEPDRVEVLTGGMNSSAYLVAGSDWQLVLKAVGLGDAAFEPGLELAARLDAAEVTTGRPRPSRRGRLVECVDGRQVGVLEYVDGEPLVEVEPEVGLLLARVHTVAAVAPADLGGWLRDLMPFTTELDLEPWIRPAVEGALAHAASLGPVSWSWLHGDPAPEAFLRVPDGLALIDWGSAMQGPILYDVASAVMYAEGHVDRVVPGYLEVRPDLTDELTSGLEAFLHVRFAIQAGYFAWRITHNVLTGIESPAENAKGLADARRSFGLTD